MDQVLIHELEVWAKVGCSKLERANTQKLLISVTAFVAEGAAIQSNNLAETVCYFKLSHDILELGTKGEWPLIEQLGADIVKLSFENFPAIRKIQVKIQKFSVPQACWVGIELVRERN
ncbi:dihydroneopterin aldolase [bacterium]|nr:dihydroneopterin aldolase [bacterium]